MAKYEPQTLEELTNDYAKFTTLGNSSSSFELESVLKRLGVANVPQLYWEYQLPPEFADTAALDYWLGQIKAYFNIDKWNKTELFDVPDNVLAKLKKNKPKVMLEVMGGGRKVKELNSALSKISATNIQETLYMLNGVACGFAPAEIQYFIQRSRQQDKSDLQCPYKDKETEIKRDEQYSEIHKYIGYSPKYILAPETCEKLIPAIKQRYDELANIQKYEEYIARQMEMD
ncbi:MAG: hypothetical protein LBO08_03445 [Rickettsiales bacterium]|jgi:hypothetical protein|nr:hypothetical protein [Rickettsiales bacterium]